MKISHMLKREDFYEINEKTLERYFYKCSNGKKLYVYPALNAIICATPSKKVKKYLYTEFSVNGNILKRFFIKAYCFLALNSLGLLSTKIINLPNDMTAEKMIFPCNKKYRIFDFEKGCVDVILKEGFCNEDLLNEISFRSENKADFIPELLNVFENGYSEKIIDGFPVARAGKRIDEYSKKAYQLFSDYISPYNETEHVCNYALELFRKFDKRIKKIKADGKELPYGKIEKYFAFLHNKMQCDDIITISLSHGDLQAGNIWVENGTEKIYIIDWESANKRFVGYDKAVLFENLRKTDGLRKYVADVDYNKAIVLAEDLLFRLQEIERLPLQYGKKDFETYIDIVFFEKQ